jgi:hypothetical protein
MRTGKGKADGRMKRERAAGGKSGEGQTMRTGKGKADGRMKRERAAGGKSGES